ncbi:hypothetical protein BC828DRAFT_377623 [Blastocladiella britannica]|nr:hypothetical protein BC828DRAFT_377623 [Blastocladiella britannica]
MEVLATRTHHQQNHRHRQQEDDDLDVDGDEQPLGGGQNGHQQALDGTLRDRRHTRMRYREIDVDLAENRAAYLADPTRLLDTLQRLDGLAESITSTAESALNARLLLATTDIVHERIHSLNLGRAVFNVQAFVTRATNAAASGTWGTDFHDALGARFGVYLKRAPAPEFMLGPMDVQVKKRETHTRVTTRLAERQVLRARQITEHTEQASSSDSSQTPKIVKAVHQELLRQEFLLPVFSFVLNPLSFAQTVENMFYVSFLIKDGHATVSMNEEDDQDTEIYLEAVRSTDAAMEHADDAEKGHRVQWIPSITKQDWRVRPFFPFLDVFDDSCLLW